MDEEVAAPICHKLWGEASGEPLLVVLTCVRDLWRKAGYLRMGFSRAASLRYSPGSTGQDVESNICCTQQLDILPALERTTRLVLGRVIPIKGHLSTVIPGLSTVRGNKQKQMRRVGDTAYLDEGTLSIAV